MAWPVRRSGCSTSRATTCTATPPRRWSRPSAARARDVEVGDSLPPVWPAHAHVRVRASWTSTSDFSGRRPRERQGPRLAACRAPTRPDARACRRRRRQHGAAVNGARRSGERQGGRQRQRRCQRRCIVALRRPWPAAACWCLYSSSVPSSARRARQVVEACSPHQRGRRRLRPLLRGRRDAPPPRLEPRRAQRLGTVRRLRRRRLDERLDAPPACRARACRARSRVLAAARAEAPSVATCSCRWRRSPQLGRVRYQLELRRRSAGAPAEEGEGGATARATIAALLCSRSRSMRPATRATVARAVIARMRCVLRQISHPISCGSATHRVHRRRLRRDGALRRPRPAAAHRRAARRRAARAQRVPSLAICSPPSATRNGQGFLHGDLPSNVRQRRVRLGGRRRLGMGAPSTSSPRPTSRAVRRSMCRRAVDRPQPGGGGDLRVCPPPTCMLGATPHEMVAGKPPLEESFEQLVANVMELRSS